jgi:predicted Zn-dependent protease
MSIESARQRWESQPDNPLVRFSLAQKLAEAELWAESIPHLQACLAARPDWLVPQLLLGKALLALGEEGDACSALEQAVSLAVAQNHEGPELEARSLLEEIRA